MRKVREIIRQHHHAGLSQRRIAKATGVSRPVVGQYLRWFAQSGLQFAEIREMSDSELEARIESPQHVETEEEGRYADLQRRLADYAAELGKKGVTRQLLWEEYRRAVPDGYSYTQFCFYLQLYTESDGILSMHLSHTPGERLFIDYAGCGPQLYDVRSGISEEQELFVATLPASGLIYCEARRSQRLSDTVEATQNALWFLEGVVQALVPDNLRAAVRKADRYEPEINATFEDMAAHYRCVVMPARGKKPRDKALVEKSVDLVYKRVLAPLRHRRFTSLSELNEAIWEKLDELNRMPMQRSGQSRLERFVHIERDELAPLPAERYVLRWFRQATVAMNYHVYLSDDRHYYSVPHRYHKRRVRIAISYSIVEIYYNHERIATHRRDPTPGGYSTKREHMPDHHREYAEWSPERFRRWAAKFGEHTAALIGGELERARIPEQNYRACMGILRLGKTHGAERLEAACRRARHYNLGGYREVKRILEKGLDAEPIEQFREQRLSPHSNIRGHHYYTATNSSKGQHS